ncbi:hypothetical protein [Tenacibaculum sp. 190524A02b]|uniref:hypothetical protein n=1 Tax=Tenacibaculum vairaonense TaxID=3137860 RepID=UPI0031FAF30A
MSDFIDETYKRVEEVIIYNNMNIRSFENKIDVSNNSIGTAIRRKASFKSNVLNKILKAFPEISPTWLLTGQGTMLIQNKAEEPADPYGEIDLTFKVKEKLLILLSEDKEILQILNNRIIEVLNDK